MTVGDLGPVMGDPRDIAAFGNYLASHSYSQKIRTFLDQQSGSADLFLDIGANIGLTTLPLAKRGVQCMAVEAEPYNFQLLTRNLKDQGVVERVETKNVALSDREGTIEFEKSAWNFGDHRIRESRTGMKNVFGEDMREIIQIRLWIDW